MLHVQICHDSNHMLCLTRLMSSERHRIYRIKSPMQSNFPTAEGDDKHVDGDNLVSTNEDHYFWFRS